MRKVFLQKVVELVDSRAVELKFSCQVDGKICCLFLLFVLKKYSETPENFDQVIFKAILMNAVESICDG